MSHLFNRQRIPLFVVAGMPRGATTFLYHYLSYHPEIYLPFRKEVNYFTVHHDRGEQWFHSLYEEMVDEKIAGDISPPCFLDNEALARIRAYRDDTKVILSVRDPREWAVSFYHQFKLLEKTMPSLEEYLQNGHDYMVGDKPLYIRFQGDWITHRIRQYQHAFGDDLLVYRFNYFKQNPLATLKIIEKFLGVGSHFNEHNFDNRRINESSRKNIKILTRLTNNQSFINVIEKTVPRKVVMTLRNHFDHFMANSSGEKSKEDSHRLEELALADKYLGTQAGAMEDLFEHGPILRGIKAYED